MTPRTRVILCSLLIIAAVVAAFWALCVSEFVSWDDPATVQHNPRFEPPTFEKVWRFWPPLLSKEQAASGQNLTGRAFGEHDGLRVNHVYGLYIPFTYTVWGALAAIAQTRTPAGATELNPWVFHCANVALHAAAGVVAFLLLHRLLARDWPAAAGALLFALHPVQVESVGWVSGMKDVLSGLLSLIALWQYVEFATTRRAAPLPLAEGRGEGMLRREPLELAASPHPNPLPKGEGTRQYAVAMLAFVLALLSKPSAVTVPLIAFVLDVLLVRRSTWWAFIALLPWLWLSGIVGTVAAYAQPALGVTPAPLWSRPLIALDSVAFDLSKLAWPLNLGIDYGRRPEIVIARGWIWLTWLLPVVIAALLIVMRRRPIRPVVAAALIVILAPLPTLGLTTFLFQYYSTTADHYLYLAMLGPALALAWALSIVRTKFIHVLAACGVALLGLRTYLQTWTWHDSGALFTHAIAVNPDSFLSHNNLGLLYLNSEPPQLALAEQQFRAAARIKPDYTTAMENLAQVLYREARPDEAIDVYEQYLKLSSQQPPELRRDLWRGHLNVARLLLERRRYDEAYDHYQQALRIDPGNVEARHGMEAAWRATHEPK